MEVFWSLIFFAIYDLLAGIFHDIKDMAESKKMYIYTYIIYICTPHTHLPYLTTLLSHMASCFGPGMVCCLVLETLLKIGCHLQSSGHMFTQT